MVREPRKNQKRLMPWNPKKIQGEVAESVERMRPGNKFLYLEMRTQTPHYQIQDLL